MSRRSCWNLCSCRRKCRDRRVFSGLPPIQWPSTCHGCGKNYPGAPEVCGLGCGPSLFVCVCVCWWLGKWWKMFHRDPGRVDYEAIEIVCRAVFFSWASVWVGLGALRLQICQLIYSVQMLSTLMLAALNCCSKASRICFELDGNNCYIAFVLSNQRLNPLYSCKKPSPSDRTSPGWWRIKVEPWPSWGGSRWEQVWNVLWCHPVKGLYHTVSLRLCFPFESFEHLGFQSYMEVELGKLREAKST